MAQAVVERLKVGEARNKKLSHEQLLKTEPRCIYCSGPPQTIEHMPSRAMLQQRRRPNAMVYVACENCNAGTRGADVVAATIARFHPNSGAGSWQAGELAKLIPALSKYAPGVREELSRHDGVSTEWLRDPKSGLLRKVARLNADGPKVKASLDIYGAKLAMALYREHVGTALPLDGAVWCQFALNAGMTQEHLEERLKIMPMFETLRQGSWSVEGQFAYRYNTDKRTVVAALAQFHLGLRYTLVASSDARIIGLFQNEKVANLPASILVRPGDLTKIA